MRLALAAVIFALPVTASAQDRQPTAWFGRSTADVGGALANECANGSASVVEQDQYHVLCSKRVSGMKGALAQALLGNSYSTTPEVKVRFAIMKDGDLTRVQADQWIETQMAFGQMRRQPLLNSKQAASLDAFMARAGGFADRDAAINSGIAKPASSPSTP